MSRLLALPADATWRHTGQRPDSIRPCQVRPAHWWDTGDPNNRKAVGICNTCPYRAGCVPADGEEAAGTIRAGVVYDDAGRPTSLCPVCDGPIIRQPGVFTCAAGHGLVAGHHDTIARMRAAGASYEAVSAAVGFSVAAVKRYWNQYLDRAHLRPVRVRRLPGVGDDSRNRPQDFHEAIVAMLTDDTAQYTYHEVAYAIGSNTEAVKGYWRRYQRRQRQAGLPVHNRRNVCHRPRRAAASAR